MDGALGHALAGGDLERAAGLVERHAGPMISRGELATVLRWLEALPEGVVRSRPQLCVAYAGPMVVIGRLDAAESLLRDAERALAAGDAGSTRGPADAPEAEADGWLVDIGGRILAIRSTVAWRRGDVPRTIELSRQALARLPEDSLFLRGMVGWNLGNAYWLSGDLAAASRTFAELGELDADDRAGHAVEPSALLAMATLGGLRVVQGRLHEAAETYRRALRLAEARGKTPSPFAGPAHLGMGELLREWNDLDAAERHLKEGIELSQRLGSVGPPSAAGYVCLARLRQARGDLAGALDALAQAQQPDPSPGLKQLFKPLELQRVRLWLSQGNLPAAAGWARERGLGVDDELCYAREAEHVVLVRVLLAQGKPDQALALLERLLGAAEVGERWGNVLEILALQALASAARGDDERALSTLARALRLAEPQGYVRTFVDEGAPLAALLRRAAAAGASAGYVSRLLSAFSPPAGGGVSPSDAGSSQATQALPEPLSRRELEVLELLAAGSSNQEIAARLVVTLDTVKKHVSHILGKLNATSRTRAVARARELGLIP